MFNSYLKEKDAIITSINSSPKQLSLQIKDMEIEESEYKSDYFNLKLDTYKFNIQSMRSWANELFESEETKVMFGTFSAFVGLAPDDAGGGSLSYLFANIIQDGGNNVVKGGFIIYQ